MRNGAERDRLCLVELSAAIDEVTSEVRHSLRNKLGSIRNASFYVRRRLSNTEAWATDPRLETMASLLDADIAGANELLGFSNERLYKRQAAPTDVRACVLEAVQCARVSARTSIQVDVPSAATHADPAELAVAIRCIIENAAEAMGDGGLVRVRGRIDGENCWVDVVDRGLGIPETDRAAALGAFYTTKPGHAGLGLNIARRTVERYGGKLVLGPSSLPTGASVSVVLRIAEEGARVDDSAGR